MGSYRARQDIANDVFVQQSNIVSILRIAEKSFIILGLSFFSGVFGVHSLGLLLPKAVITFIRFFIWGASTILVCLFWKNAIITFSRNIFFCFLTLLAIFSFIWSDFPAITLFDTRDILMMTSFSLYFAIRFNQKEQVQIIAFTLLIGGILSTIIALGLPGVGVHGAQTGMETESHPGAWKGVYGHKNTLGSMMVLSGLTFFTLPKENSNIYKWSGLVFSLILMLLSTSKTSLVLSFILILIIVFYKKYRWRGKISVIFIDIGILTLGCIAVLVFTYWVELLTSLGRDATLTGRIPLWGAVINRLIDRPLLGYGRSAFWTPQSGYAIEVSRAIGTSWIPPHAHNGLLDLALDVGLIGVSLFVITYFTTFFQVLKRGYATKNPQELWLLAYLAFLTMNNVTESYLLRQSNLYWVLFSTVIFTVNQKFKPKKVFKKVKKNWNVDKLI